jgi:hypothetical protein
MSQTEDSELLLVRYDLRMLPSHVKPITLWAVSQWGVIGDVVLRFAELRKLFIFSDKGWLQVFSVRMYRHLWHRYWLPALDPFLTTLHTVPSTRIMAPFPDHVAYCTRHTQFGIASGHPPPTRTTSGGCGFCSCPGPHCQTESYPPMTPKTPRHGSTHRER